MLRSDFRSPLVTISKEALRRYTGRDPKTIKNALRQLKEIGLIKVVANAQGGQSVAPTYELLVPDKEGRQTPTLCMRETQTPETAAQKEGVERTQSGGEPHPHSQHSHSSSGRDALRDQRVDCREDQSKESERCSAEAAQRIVDEFLEGHRFGDGGG